MGSARRILDFGCGIGILTTFFARRHPESRFVGVDRSSASIDYASRRAAELRLDNVEFHRIDVDREAVSGSYDLVLATHALLQAEQDPGIPSDRWESFARGGDVARQTAFELRTGLAPRLDRLLTTFADQSRMIVFEKTRLLARRVPFQRALAARGLRLLEPPEPVRYALVEEVADDGPLYVLGRPVQASGIEWSERPEEVEADTVNLDSLRGRAVSGEDPLYENHTAAAQVLWQSLPDRRVMKEFTKEGQDGRQLHAELGTTRDLFYLYVANTFDQRQILLIEAARARVLDCYFADIERDHIRGTPS